MSVIFLRSLQKNNRYNNNARQHFIVNICPVYKNLEPWTGFQRLHLIATIKLVYIREGAKVSSLPNRILGTREVPDITTLKPLFSLHSHSYTVTSFCALSEVVTLANLDSRSH